MSMSIKNQNIDNDTLDRGEWFNMTREEVDVNY
jgi:hypothetical protein